MIGARTVFVTKAGKRFGHQEVTGLEPERRVELALTALAGPPQRPVLTFELEPLGPARTRVVLRFRNTITRPFNVLLRVFGVVRWTRAMHNKDLDGLRRYAEPPRQTYAGAPVPGLAESTTA